MKQYFKTLIHNGPTFPKKFETLNLKLKNTPLDLKAEEMLYMVASYKERYNEKIFKNNFYKDLKPFLTKEQLEYKFPEDYEELLEKIRNIKEIKKASTTKEEKLSKKNINEQLKEKYGYAFVDGEKVPLTTYITEGARIFIGRGNHPKTGCWIETVTPEEITINCSGEVPKAPEGHNWGKIVFNPERAATFYYTIDKIKATKQCAFAQKSEFGMNKNKEKFDKVKILVEKWDTIKEGIQKALKSDERYIQENGCISYLIQTFGIRAGNEERAKQEGFANDVVGASTLRKNNIKFLENNTIELNYLGKDSVPFFKVTPVDPTFYKVLKNIYNTSTTEFIFKNTASDVNLFFDSLVPNITCKNFRTSYGSALLAKELRNLEISPTETVTSIKTKLDKAQLVVAEKLNHQKNINSKQEQSFKEALNKLKTKEKELKSKYDELKQQLSEETNKDKKLKLKEKVEKAKLRYNDSISKIENKKELKNSALGTSKANYSDPRLLYSFCLDKSIDIKYVYSKTVWEKFKWVESCTDETFYKTYPTIEE